MNRRFSIQNILSKVRMLSMWLKIRHLVDPVLQYLNQPVGHTDQHTVWNPNRFWYLYRINLLEKCWQKAAANKGQHTY